MWSTQRINPSVSSDKYTLISAICASICPLYCFMLTADALAGRSNTPIRSLPLTTFAPSTVSIGIPVDATFLIALKTGGSRILFMVLKLKFTRLKLTTQVYITVLMYTEAHCWLTASLLTTHKAHCFILHIVVFGIGAPELRDRHYIVCKGISFFLSLSVRSRSTTVRSSACSNPPFLR